MGGSDQSSSDNAAIAITANGTAANGNDTQKPAAKKKEKKALGKGKKGSGSSSGAKGVKTTLFQPMTLRGLTVRNRIWLPPMDTYSAVARDGKPTPFHYQHYVSRAFGGFGMIIAEATAVSPEGRISPNDLGLWNDDQIEAWRWIVSDVKAAGAAMAVQLNHAGRKGSTGCFGVGFEGRTVPFEEGGWQTVAPSEIAFGGYATPRELSIAEIRDIISQFRASAARAVIAGFQAIELHAAHGYLISQFLDPLCNERTDEYGGNISGRMRFLLEIVDAVRSVIPDDMPLLVRISATDWAAGGWDLDQTVIVSRALKERGVDLVDVSTGGIIADVTIPVKPGYQVPFSAQVRSRADVPVTAVGLITKPKQAEKIVARGEADAVEIGRAALRDPYWPLRAADKLGIPTAAAPYAPQYVRGAY
ncbi:NADH:flavin oxidoreductase/NADH oxidase [Bifidobacterium jacchi]|uniref:NADH:flavin oxidoreductase/NADH oxidase n=2 Tax=Bifidobacterium jacchi TaxID=2490545 RepID=A0A5N5RHX0_9BIFI|nr:NADH:flavin oxidoreductase/NADH oxidase [Bifidobacterium jacchi]